MYCTAADLLVKDILLSPGSTHDIWVERAAEEMHALLGAKYVIPITPAPGYVALGNYESLVLKMINSKLASGRLILALATNDENDSIHAYGRMLIREAMESLVAILNGVVNLDSALTVIPINDDEHRVPSVTTRDSESLVEVWENNIMRGEDVYGMPGS